jgi:CRISPR-associated protein Csm1
LANDGLISGGKDMLAQSCRVALAVFRRGLETFAGYAGADAASVDCAWPAADGPVDAALAEIIAAADQIASGLISGEKEEASHGGSLARTARLSSLLEGVDPEREPGSLGPDDARRYWMPLKNFSPDALFPQSSDEKTAPPASDGAAVHAEYAGLWQSFVTALKSIPESHRANLPLWLDHFDACWQTFAHAIPIVMAGEVQSGVSLYDHSRGVAALAVALWRWHQSGVPAVAAEHGVAGGQAQKFLLVQGNFSGIQDFIFSSGGQTQKQAARLLRGRSFQVSLLTELAALAVLEALQLPPACQITNAAGKFLIIAPHLPQTVAALRQVRLRLDAWCLEHSFGQISVSVMAQPASGNDFAQHNFPGLTRRLFAALDEAKLRCFDLCGAAAPAPVRPADFRNGPCAYDGQRPAEKELTDLEGQRRWVSRLAADQIAIGQRLADPGYTRLLVTSGRQGLRDDGQVKPLELDYLGYAVAFAHQDATEEFGELARQGGLLRCWDFSLPGKDAGVPLFQGYARREINAYVPTEGKQPVTLDEIAEKDAGLAALAVLKGDVDHLGAIFQQGIPRPTLTKTAALSRQINAFFAVYLPWLCLKRFPDIYTVFAGGDDFFLIGPWEQTQHLARQLRKDFHRFAASNAKLTFSAGIVMTKPRVPIRAQAARAEAALENAKNPPDGSAGRNRLGSFRQIVTWEQREQLAKLEDWLEQRHAQFSAGFVYRLLPLSEKAASQKPEDAIWRSWLTYHVRRFIVDKLPAKNETERAATQTEWAGYLTEAIACHKRAIRIPISNYMYRHRD